MSQLDIAERRLPQDGRIKLKLGKGKEMDYRVSTCRPSSARRSSCASSTRNLQLDMTKLGFDGPPRERVLDIDGQALRHLAGHRPHRQR
jgi:type IV pilus assembly protein PilB